MTAEQRSWLDEPETLPPPQHAPRSHRKPQGARTTTDASIPTAPPTERERDRRAYARLEDYLAGW